MGMCVMVMFNYNWQFLLASITIWCNGDKSTRTYFSVLVQYRTFKSLNFLLTHEKKIIVMIK
jgi:hypothetical protein